MEFLFLIAVSVVMLLCITGVFSFLDIVDRGNAFLAMVIGISALLFLGYTTHYVITDKIEREFISGKKFIKNNVLYTCKESVTYKDDLAVTNGNEVIKCEVVK